jgi:hypothetical protein
MPLLRGVVWIQRGSALLARGKGEVLSSVPGYWRGPEPARSGAGMGDTLGCTGEEFLQGVAGLEGALGLFKVRVRGAGEVLPIPGLASALEHLANFLLLSG